MKLHIQGCLLIPFQARIGMYVSMKTTNLFVFFFQMRRVFSVYLFLLKFLVNKLIIY
jgi:hypothetical protein